MAGRQWIVLFTPGGDRSFWWRELREETLVFKIRFAYLVTIAFESYEFHKVVQLINRYCSGVLSSTYHDIIKDRLYTLHPNDHKRRSTQTGVHMIFEALIRLIGPIMPFTADEAWSYHKSRKSSC